MATNVFSAFDANITKGTGPMALAKGGQAPSTGDIQNRNQNSASQQTKQ